MSRKGQAFASSGRSWEAEAPGADGLPPGAKHDRLNFQRCWLVKSAGGPLAQMMVNLHQGAFGFASHPQLLDDRIGLRFLFKPAR